MNVTISFDPYIKLIIKLTPQLIFLHFQSDDPPVPRTCYDAMRHEECGDVIRPRDCVLLRAGGKRNELPYVAKVAQLWENPEDGEFF